ncbi:O-phosphoserine--tRNA ligase [Patescibacteria group bacterium]
MEKEKNKKSHPVIDLVEKFRKVLLDFGFEEIINPSIVNEKDVYKQYGPEAPLILDRSFYLAGLSRVNLGISKKTAAKIKEIVNIDVKKLQEIFHEYKKGKIEADNLVEEFVKSLKIKTKEAMEILNLFPELKKLKPIPTKLVLRSHMTAAWFLTISSLIKKSVPPLKLFSIGSKFRKEQRENSLHLYESQTASLVIVGKNIDLKSKKEFVKKILSKLGFKKATFKTKSATSNYYAPGTEFEVFIKKDGKDIEIADGGIYSSESLLNYHIPYSVFNVGFGIERIAMLIKDVSDIRQLVYPQFYTSVFFSDKEIAKSIKLKEEPKTKLGKELAKKIKAGILKYQNEIGPKKFLIYKGNGVKVFISEPEDNKKLLGPAGLNVVYVHDGNILGISKKDEKSAKIVKEGIKTYSYLEAISNLFASLVEKKSFGRHTVKIADTLPSINLKIDKAIEKFITSKNKQIHVIGPIFVDLEIEKD